MKEINDLNRKLQNCFYMKESMKQYKIDVAILGDGAVGKSAVLERWLKGEFSESYKPTVSETFEKRTRRRQSASDTSELDLRIFDTCGSMAFPAMNRVTISRSDAFLIVYSVDSEKSFECAERLLNEVSEIKSLERIPLVIVGNKADLPADKRQVTFERGLQLAVRVKAPFMEVSAKTGRNVEDAFYALWKRYDTVTFLSNPNFCPARDVQRTRTFLGMKLSSKNIPIGVKTRYRSSSFL